MTIPTMNIKYRLAGNFLGVLNLMKSRNKPSEFGFKLRDCHQMNGGMHMHSTGIVHAPSDRPSEPWIGFLFTLC